MEILLNNRSFLRELPDAPPWEDQSFSKNHSFIFPGDEIVLYNNIKLPADAGASSMNEIVFKNVTCSLIARKPNIFTNVFSSQFQATRSFVLDSQTVNLSNKVAPGVAWFNTTTGVNDGYAPNLNYQAPRNWKLPPNDFHRQLNLFTSHTPGTSSWTYWFYFPILFRWEYWKKLPTADGDFVNANGTTGAGAGAVQDNRTYNWTNYSANPLWQIVSQLQLNLLVNGDPVTLTSELVLNRLTTSIQTYSSNPDYTDKSIMTCPVGGIPSNTPCALYTTQNTDVFAYWTKVATWGYREQSKITGYMWIEVFQGAGSTQRLRASSSCAATPESCFISVQTPLLNDDGSPQLNNDDNPILHDPQGVALIFNGQKVTMWAQIDFNKLLASFPNATGFNIYARIYNNSVFTD